jgi:phage/plasmid-associated DNA primase
MVRGLVRYHKSGLETPVQMEIWKGEYRSDSDEFLEFIEDVIVRDGDVTFIPTQHVYDAYAAWVEKGGRGRPMSIKAFSSALKERSFESKTGRIDGKQSRGFAGITLRSSGVMF